MVSKNLIPHRDIQGEKLNNLWMWVNVGNKSPFKTKWKTKSYVTCLSLYMHKSILIRCNKQKSSFLTRHTNLPLVLVTWRFLGSGWSCSTMTPMRWVCIHFCQMLMSSIHTGFQKFVNWGNWSLPKTYENGKYYNYLYSLLIKLMQIHFELQNKYHYK